LHHPLPPRALNQNHDTPGHARNQSLPPQKRENPSNLETE
jgi:hypothetical protein